MSERFKNYNKENQAWLICEQHIHPGTACCPCCIDDRLDGIECYGIDEHPENKHICVELCCEGRAVLAGTYFLGNIEAWEKALERYEQEQEGADHDQARI